MTPPTARAVRPRKTMRIITIHFQWLDILQGGPSVLLKGRGSRVYRWFWRKSRGQRAFGEEDLGRLQVKVDNSYQLPSSFFFGCVLLVLLLLFAAAAVFVDFVAAFCVVVVAWPPFWSPPDRASPPLPQKFLYQF